MIIGFGLAATLDQLMERLRFAFLEFVGQTRGGHAGPSRREEIGRDFCQFLLRRFSARHRADEIEGRIGVDIRENLRGHMFVVGHDKRLFARLGIQDRPGHLQELGRGLGDGFRGAGDREGHRLIRLGVKTKKGLQRLNCCLSFFVTMATHLTFAVTAQVMRINRQEPAFEMAAGPSQTSKRYLQLLCSLDRLGLEQAVYRLVGGDERQAARHFKASLTQGVFLAHPRDAQGRFMNQLHREARFDALGALAGPGAQKVPCSQAQMLGRQKPNADHRSRNLVGQKLPNASLDRGRIARLAATFSFGSLRLEQNGIIIRSKGIEFFFEGRIGR